MKNFNLIRNKVVVCFATFLCGTSVLYAASAYRPAVQAGRFLYISGQNAQEKSESLKQQSVQQQTEKALDLIKMTLKNEGYQLSDVVDVTVALAKDSDFPDFNKAYIKYLTPYFPNGLPARSTGLGVLHQNRGAKVEISMVAYK